MKYQVLFSLKKKKNNEKYSRPSSAALLIGALRVKVNFLIIARVHQWTLIRITCGSSSGSPREATALCMYWV